MSATPLLDADMMYGLKELLADKFDQLVDTFVHDGSERVKRLGEAIINTDLSAVCMEAHALKGSSRNIGADAFAVLCGEVEKQARNGDAINLKEKFSRIEKDFAELCVEVETYI